YTTQARTKALNRRCEAALHDAEFLACLRPPEEYPRAELDRLWKPLLLNQFPATLPGSSIRLAVEEAERDLAGVLADANALCVEGDELVNTIGFARREVVDGRMVQAPPYGAGAVVEAGDEVRVDGLVLENALVRAELAEDGSLLSLVHKPTGRETLARPGNRLELYEDRPLQFDAWDIDPFHLETRRDFPPAESWSVAAAGPLRGEIAFVRPGLTQVVRLDAGSPRLEFHTTVDWDEE